MRSYSGWCDCLQSGQRAREGGGCRYLSAGFAMVDVYLRINVCEIESPQVEGRATERVAVLIGVSQMHSKDGKRKYQTKNDNAEPRTKVPTCRFTQR